MIDNKNKTMIVEMKAPSVIPSPFTKRFCIKPNEDPKYKRGGIDHLISPLLV
jgi:hypothetical protein